MSDQSDGAIEQETAESYEDPEDSVCTTFRVETGIVNGDGDPRNAWSFECTRCGHYTVCVDDPSGYAGRPYKCMECAWVSLIDPEAAESFRGGEYQSEYGGGNAE